MAGPRQLKLEPLHWHIKGAHVKVLWRLKRRGRQPGRPLLTERGRIGRCTRRLSPTEKGIGQCRTADIAMSTLPALRRRLTALKWPSAESFTLDSAAYSIILRLRN